MNANSIIIYACAALMLLTGFLQKEWGATIGVVIGIVIITLFLADEQDRKNIKKNLLWRT
jgi:type IV secretory pathway VirB2 component (pilin)